MGWIRYPPQKGFFLFFAFRGGFFFGVYLEVVRGLGYGVMFCLCFSLAAYLYPKRKRGDPECGKCTSGEVERLGGCLGWLSGCDLGGGCEGQCGCDVRSHGLMQCK